MAKDKKEVNETSLAGRAWNATKEENDPEWGAIPNSEFKGKLEHAAERVKATGTAQTNFENAVKEFAAEDAKSEEAPMAVVSPRAATDAGSTAPMAVATEPTTPAAKKAASKAKTAAKKAAPAKKAAKAVAAKTDKSGHVATGAEAKAAVDAEKEAPLHP